MAPPPHIIATPRWLLSLRYTQITLAIIILGVSAYGLYWLELSAWGFALFMSLATIIIAVYNITTQTIPNWSVAYNYWAILALDIFGVICWLSAMADLAATRAIFDVPTEINECIHTDNGGVCDRKLLKREDVAGNGYLAAMSATAGISALEMILFAVTLIVFSIHLHRYRSTSSLNPSTVRQEYKLENATLAGTGGVGYAPLGQPQQQQQQQYMQPQPYEQYTPQHQQQQWAPQPQGGQYGQPMPPQGQQQQYYQ